ncbi:hypothetical protein PFISCL1PPCAC_2607 [Pristionchus fissidentatus]|uniref:Uncharacterized protein n=1 Tax=Pristionchus fissidentatus TaxID=1538716 RepID=A0AAV5V0G4_9BILA|nr:hypothetical protein PFISCL1PPCAC_2607 [Pristionchus fissidentatus]
MADVCYSNFREWFPELVKVIDQAAFFAIDLEFLGLPSSARDDLVPTLFDESEQRYKKIVGSVRRYPPCQLGIAAFMERDDGASYEVESFAIPLFKRLPHKQVFSYSLSAVSFLANNNFDFNKFIVEGVTYSNARQTREMKAEILSGGIDYDIFEDGLEHRLQILKINFQRAAQNAIRLSHNTFHRSPSARSSTCGLQLPHPILIELVRSGEFIDTDTVDQTMHPPWDRPLSPLEKAVIEYVFTNDHRHLEFSVSHDGSLLYVAELPVLTLLHYSEEEWVAEKLDKLLLEVSGVSEIVRLMLARKVPIVGHNSFLDLVYLYECFVDDLPDSYDDWKAATRKEMPTVFDTKIIACLLKAQLSENGVTDHSLKTLGAFFESASCGQILPFSYPAISEGPCSQFVFGVGEHFHNAAFDARVTGSIFIKMLYLYAYTKSSGHGDFSRLWQLRKLIFACRNDFANRVPIPLIDYLHCYLPGADPHGHRPAPLRVRKRRRWPWMGMLNGRSERTVDAVVDWIVGRQKFTEHDMVPLRGELKREMGAFRVDVARSEEEEGVALVATNTPKTFARVARYLAAHTSIRPIDEKNCESVSWEELLMSSEELKRRRRVQRRRRKTTGDHNSICREEETEGEDRMGTIALLTAGITSSLFIVGTVIYWSKS